MDLVAIQAAISSLKTATDISKSILDIKSTAEIQGKVIELQSALLEAQTNALSATSAQFELQEQVRALEAKLKEVGDWEEEKKRYALVNPWQNAAQAYALKEASAEGEGAHLLCPNCFHNKKKTILNPSSIKGWVIMICPHCKASMETGYRGIGPSEYAEKYAENG